MIAPLHDSAMAAGRRVVVCAGTGCIANGAQRVFQAFLDQIAAAGVAVTTEFEPEAHDHDLRLHKSGCQGFCQMGPLVTILPDGVLYRQVKVDDVPEIIGRTLVNREVVDRLLYVDPSTGKACPGPGEIPFYRRQQRRVLDLCGVIDPECIREYLHHNGYTAARKAFRELTPEAICAEITRSGLRGRGGGGFPTGRKWDAARLQAEPEKYVICNADEGDPGAFMNRSVMEGNPHSVLEGLMIAARAIGARESIIYVRAEYPLAVRRMRQAVRDAQAMGFLGANVFESGLGLTCEVLEGAGAFVCGEETALIASLEGCRGMPRPKPPFPAQSGLWGQPTVINNVETLVQAARIIREGAAHFREVGTLASPGTKTFALTGHVANTGLIEVPFGTTLREVVEEIGGGITDRAGHPSPEGFKAVQIGGPSGGCLTREHLDLPLDYDSLRDAGAMVGSGGLVAMNQRTCMVAIARFFMDFTQRESCGKCVLCREGTRQMLALLDEIIEGRASGETLELLEKLARAVQKGSLCGLGKTAPNPVLSTLRYFRTEYDAHVFHRHCPTGQCRALAKASIDPVKCKGCTACVRHCPVGAIQGERKKPHTILAARCIKCGACVKACKFNAITGLS